MLTCEVDKKWLLFKTKLLHVVVARELRTLHFFFFFIILCSNVVLQHLNPIGQKYILFVDLF